MSRRLFDRSRRTRNGPAGPGAAVGVVAVCALLAAGAVTLAAPADAAGGAVASLAITPSSVTATSGQCVTFTVTELATDKTTATSGQFTPTVTLGGNTIATYGTPVAGPILGLPPACTDSSLTAGAGGSVFTFGVVTTDPLDLAQTTTITVSNSSGTITTGATESVGSPSTTTPPDVALGFGAPTSGLGETCPTTSTDPMTATGATQEVCARVTTDSGLQGVSGDAVTFTVDNGAVADTAADATAATATTTYTVASDSSGVATAFVSSAGPGAQTITAVTGTGDDTSTSNGLTDTYQGPNVEAATLTLTPRTATIASGGSQRFTATVTDPSGQGVENVPVDFDVHGSGSIAGAIAVTVDTGSDGTAVVTVSPQLGDTAAGAGSLTATAGTPAGAAQTSTSTSTYTISARPEKTVTTRLTLTSPTQHHLREVATLNRALRHVSVDFYTIRHGRRTYVGASATNARGVATFTLGHLTSHTTVHATARPVHLPRGYKAGTYARPAAHTVK